MRVQQSVNIPTDLGRASGGTALDRRTLTVGLVAALVVFATLAALVFSPGVLQPQVTTPDTGNGDGNGEDDGNGGTTPQESVPVETPSWAVGDSWTYNVSMSHDDVSITSDRSPEIVGNYTQTVTAIEADAYNVSVTGAFRLRGYDVMQALATDGARVLVDLSARAYDATLEGHSLYRTEDLAILEEVRIVNLDATIETDKGTYSISYTKTIAVTYEPAFDIWDFPLDENETWHAGTNATIRVWVAWTIEGPNLDHADDHNYTVTVPVQLLLSSGKLADVVTPAGTFASIPVEPAHPEIWATYLRERLGVLEILDVSGLSRDGISAAVWFSGDVGNIVKAEATGGDRRIDIILVAFEVA